MRRAAKPFLLWIVSLLMALSLAVFQRLTGPTYPKRGEVDVGSHALRYRLPRSHGGETDMPVGLATGQAVVQGVVYWRRHPTEDDWCPVRMERKDGVLLANIPHQPPAGKVEYRIILQTSSGERIPIPNQESVVARFKGEVPLGILIPHVVAMFSSMLFSTRAFLEAARKEPRAGSGSLVIVAMALLVAGGLFLGPTVQMYAFGAFWTGWPFGEDFTDNKTLAAFLAWLPATIAAVRKRPSRRAIILGWLVMMGVFMIPHSYRGSEIDWSKLPAESQP